ncbi:MAG: ribosome-associated toxin RatA of RatAB toxin-antitoxin module [Polyangiales bacterium]
MNALGLRGVFMVSKPMQHSKFRYALIALLIGVFTSAPADAQPDPNRGITTHTVPAQGTSVRFGVANVVLDYPMQQVVDLLHDYGRFQDYLPHFQTSRVLSQRGNRALMYVEVTAARDTITLWAQTRVSSSDENGTRVIEARMTEGNLDHFVVRWEIASIDATHTRVNFRLLADPQVPLPASIMTTENERFSGRVLNAVRRRLEAQ